VSASAQHVRRRFTQLCRAEASAPFQSRPGKNEQRVRVAHNARTHSEEILIHLGKREFEVGLCTIALQGRTQDPML